MAFTNEQLERYSRHIILKEVGVKRSEKASECQGSDHRSRRTWITGSPLPCSCRCGNHRGSRMQMRWIFPIFQRQVIHTTADVGKLKVESAAETMKAINPDVTVNTYHTFVDSSNIMDLIKDYDFILDGTDNFPAKFLINDACVMAEKPFSHAGIIRFQGQLMTYVPGQGPCYRCAFQSPPPKDAVPTCKQAGVIGAMGGVIGSFRQWKRSSTSSDRVIFLQEDFSPTMH